MQVGVHRHVIATLLFLTLAVLAVSSAVGAGPDDTALPALLAPAGDGVGLGSTSDPTVVRSRAVTVASDLLSGLQPKDRLALELFDDLSVVMVFETAGASGAWSGTIVGDPPGTFTLVSGADGTAAILRVPGQGTYRIRPRAAGAHVVEQLDETGLPPCGGAPVREPPAGGAARAGGCDDGSVIDVLVVYTPVAVADAEGAGVIETLTTLAVSNANFAYGASLITPRLNLVSMQEIEYYENGTYSQHLNRLTDPGDGYMDEVHDLRDQYSADMVALIVADNAYCGMAWLMQDNDPSFESMAFSVTSWFCLEFQTLAHELGHNQGCCHAPGDGGGCNNGGLYPYSLGYRYTGDSGELWRTIMAYDPGTRIDHFSNPDVAFDGEPTGVPTNQPDAAHNALTINQTALTVANFRCRPPLMNDLCADALPIFDGDTFVDTTDANTDGPAHAGCGVIPDGGQTCHDIWYVYTASCTGELTVSTCNQADYDTDLVVYDGADCGDLQFLGCNEDASGCAGNSSELTVPVV
ncbi:MAG: M12 family metallo-peptidase, partial [Planctomycetota bacterium]